MPATSARHEVLVVGGGPAGAATAYWLASAGHDVLVVEKKTFPREKTCGDGLTPRAVRQLHDMGLGERLADFHRFNGLRALAHGITLELEWPEHPVLPVVRVRRAPARSRPAGRGDRGEGRGDRLGGRRSDRADHRPRARARRDRPRTRRCGLDYVVVADGANSRFGRAIGTSRDRSYPQGMAIRGYFESPLHADPWIESALDVKDRNGNSLPGYGWIFPVGDGAMNVGVGLLSTFRDYSSVNTTHLMNEFVATAPEYWEISADTAVGEPTGGRLPMGGSVGPKVGPTWLVVGDAAGSVNPFNGEGIDYAYETGRLAAQVLHEALSTGDGLALQQYRQAARRRVRPVLQGGAAVRDRDRTTGLMRELTRVGMQPHAHGVGAADHGEPAAPDELGPAEAAYKAAAALARAFPDR